MEIDETYCKGCGLCVAFCERGILELSSRPNSRGIYAAHAMAGMTCLGCRRCALVCPEAAVRLSRP